MPQVSIDAPSLRLGYGVRADDTFWCKQGVLRIKELRDGLDEQIIADLAASILLGVPFAASRERLDDAYDPNNPLYTDLNDRLAAYSQERLALEMKTTFSALIETIEAVSDTPNTFRRTVNPTAGGNPVRTPFYTVYMAFHKLIVRDKKQPVDPSAIMNALRRLASRLEADVHHVRSEDRRKNIDLTLGLIQSHFVDKDPPLLGHGKGLAVDFENSLRRSKIETPRYEFKQGICRLYEGRERDEALLGKLVEEACAIANLGPESNGFIFIGVADNEKDSIRVKELDNVNPIQIGNVFVVGVDREATLANQKLDLYVRSIVSFIRKSDLSEPLKSDMLGCVDTVEYRGMSVIRITLPAQKQMSWVGEQAFIREGSETKKASAKQIALLVERFAAKK